MTQIISVRIDDHLYEQVKRYSINASEVIRKSLEDEVSSIEREILVEKVKQLSEKLKGESPANFLMVNKKVKKEL